MVAMIQLGLGSVIKRTICRNLTELFFHPGIPRWELEHYRVREWYREGEREVGEEGGELGHEHACYVGGEIQGLLLLP